MAPAYKPIKLQGKELLHSCKPTNSACKSEEAQKLQ